MNERRNGTQNPRRKSAHIWAKMDSKRPGGGGQGEQELIASHHQMRAWGALKRRMRGAGG